MAPPAEPFDPIAAHAELLKRIKVHEASARVRASEKLAEEVWL
jgi:hypothetical protein